MVKRLLFSLLADHSKSLIEVLEFYLIRGSCPISNHLGLWRGEIYYMSGETGLIKYGKSMETHVMESNFTPPHASLTVLQ